LKQIISWSARVPIFRKLGIAIGIPFGLLCVVLVLVSGDLLYSVYGLILIGALFLLTYLFVVAVYGGNYEFGYCLSSIGIQSYTLPKQARKNRWINGLAVVLGLISTRPAAAGAGLLAESRQSVFLRWKGVRKVQFLPRRKVILVRGGLAERIALFCCEDNYQQVEDFVRNNAGIFAGGQEYAGKCH